MPTLNRLVAPLWAATGTDHAWNAFGRQIYDVVDIVNNTVYCFYWSPQNVAYTLANIDSNMALVNSLPTKKPVRPYFWTLLHGGGLLLCSQILVFNRQEYSFFLLFDWQSLQHHPGLPFWSLVTQGWSAIFFSKGPWVFS